MEQKSKDFPKNLVFIVAIFLLAVLIVALYEFYYLPRIDIEISKADPNRVTVEQVTDEIHRILNENEELDRHVGDYHSILSQIDEVSSCVLRIDEYVDILLEIRTKYTVAWKLIKRVSKGFETFDKAMGDVVLILALANEISDTREEVRTSFERFEKARFAFEEEPTKETIKELLDAAGDLNGSLLAVQKRTGQLKSKLDKFHSAVQSAKKGIDEHCPARAKKVCESTSGAITSLSSPVDNTRSAVNGVHKTLMQDRNTLSEISSVMDGKHW